MGRLGRARTSSFDQFLSSFYRRRIHNLGAVSRIWAPYPEFGRRIQNVSSFGSVLISFGAVLEQFSRTAKNKTAPKLLETAPKSLKTAGPSLPV